MIGGSSYPRSVTPSESCQTRMYQRAAGASRISRYQLSMR